jgi:histone H3/H4
MSDREGEFPHCFYSVCHFIRTMSIPVHGTRFDDECRLTWGRKGNDDLSLPKATVQKIINEILAHDPGLPFARETRDLLIECCVEFITLISSEANEIAEKDAKKTIACEHVTTALEQLGYPDYVPEILKVAQEHKTQQVVCILLPQSIT